MTGLKSEYLEIMTLKETLYHQFTIPGESSITAIFVTHNKNNKH